MLPTAETLVRLSPDIRPDRARLYARALSVAVETAAITTATQLAMFMGAVAYHSNGFAGLTETLDYRDPDRLAQAFANDLTPAEARLLVAAGPVAIAERVYGGRYGNGPGGCGDGYRYRGRGFLLTTGRTAYGQAEVVTGLPLRASPEMLSDAFAAAALAGRLWSHSDLNAAAERDDVQTVLRALGPPETDNTPMAQTWFARSKAIWT